ncbi:MAG: response regulator [Melioribacteraceae bacterium]|nr:response regulator [Melioribacteraceae bacterium]
MNSDKEVTINLSSDSTLEIINVLNLPIAFADEHYKISWYSHKFNTLIEGDIQGTELTKLFSFNPDSLKENELYSESNLFWEIRIKRTVDFSEKYRYIIFLEEKSHVSSKLKERIKSIKNFAHDLNNILTSITNSASVLKTEIGASERTLRLLNNIESNSLRAADIIHQVLSQSDKKETVKKRIDVKKLLDELRNSLQNIIPKNIEMEYIYDESLYPVTGNHSDLYRVILNLCINGSEAIKRKGRIIVKASNVKSDDNPVLQASKYDSFIKITVKDNGTGIKKSYLPQIFNPGFSTKIKANESGLGLNIVKEIVNEHGGHIIVESRRWFGTKFTIYLPARVTVTESAGRLPEDISILIADDEVTILDLLTELLESYNYNIIKAVNGNDVVKLYKKNPIIDLIIIDRKMPELDGLECISKLQELGYSNPIILTSGSQSVHEVVTTNGINIDKIITKPYDFEELLEEVKLLLQKATSQNYPDQSS